MKSETYWKNRAINRLAESEKQSNKYISKLKKIYTNANRDIKKEIATIYKNYSKETGIDVHALKELLSKKDTDEFWNTMKGKGLKQYVQNNYKSRINRLEQIQGQLYARAKEIYKDEIDTVYGHYKGVINNSYYRTIYDTQIGTGYDFAFNKLDENTINAILNEKWYGGNYSQRVWNNTELLANKLSESLGSNLISGKPSSTLIREISVMFDVANYYAERLVRTETNHFNAEAEALAYNELGVKKYVFIATLDNRTSEICQEHDNKVYDFEKKKTGVNFPPMHPNCRSTYRAYLGEVEEKNLKRRARNPVTGKTEIIDNMSYEEWKKHIDNRYRTGTFDLEYKKHANLKKDKEQYEKYINVLGANNMPKTLEKWQYLKYTNINDYNAKKHEFVLKKHYNKVIAIGDLSPLVDFETYKKIDNEIYTELVGLKTTNKIEIKSYSKHFVDRVCGSIEQKRNGVEIADIKENILKSTEFKISKKNADSIKIISDNNIVSINPKTGNLIQVNPRGE